MPFFAKSWAASTCGQNIVEKGVRFACFSAQQTSRLLAMAIISGLGCGRQGQMSHWVPVENVRNAAANVMGGEAWRSVVKPAKNVEKESQIGTLFSIIWERIILGLKGIELEALKRIVAGLRAVDSVEAELSRGNREEEFEIRLLHHCVEELRVAQ